MNGKCTECESKYLLDEKKNTCVDDGTNTTHCDEALNTGCKKCLS